MSLVRSWRPKMARQVSTTQTLAHRANDFHVRSRLLLVVGVGHWSGGTSDVRVIPL